MTNAVIIATNMGNITVELDPEKAPGTVKNFLAYVNEGYYNGTIFHRVIKDFMIQGGGFDQEMRQKHTLRAPIINESAGCPSNKKYTISMARTNQPDSATCQFFINVKDNAFLDYREGRGSEGYAVFGKVIDGMDVVDKISKTRTRRFGQHDDVPATDMVIESISVVETK